MPEFFDDCTNLRPLKGVAEILAQDKSWGKLYDLEQLAKNEVRVSAVSYVFTSIPENWIVSMIIFHFVDITMTCMSILPLRRRRRARLGIPSSTSRISLCIAGLERIQRM
jgi:hypothetical protein